MNTDKEATAETQGPPAAAPDETPSQARLGLKKAAIGSAIWTVLGMGGGQVLRFVSNIILARLFFPEAFGLMALVYAWLTGLHLFADVGLRTSIVQSKRGEDPSFLNTAWTVQIIRGLILWVGSGLLAWPVAYLREKPEPLLFWLLPLLGITAFLDGLNSTALDVLSRRLVQGRLMLLELGSQVVGLIVTIAWAWVQPTVWALASGPILGTGLKMLLSHLVLPGFRNRWCWDRSALHELLHFGRWIYLSTAFTFIAGQADRLVVGAMSLGLLGIYHFAVQLAQVPYIVASAFAAQLVFPLYSKLHQSGVDMRIAFPRMHLATAGFAALLVAGVIATGSDVVQCLYDHRYQGAGWMLQLLAIGVWFQILDSVEISVMWALGLPRASAVSNGAKVLSLFVLVPAGTWWWGFPGMILGFVAGDCVRYASTVWFVRRQNLPVLRYDLPLTLFIGVASMTALSIGQLLWPDRVRPESLALLAVTPEAGFPASLPWAALTLSFKRDWAHLLVRLVIEGSTVVLLWSGVMLFCWSRGMFRMSPK